MIEAAVVWMPHHTVRLVRLGADEKALHRQHLERIAGGVLPPAQAGQPESGTDVIEARTCAYCAGRCCRPGASRHAFIDEAVLARWLDRHPGATADQAVQAYVQALPTWHNEGSCVYHGRRGCTLRREWRSDVCNRFACDELQHARLQVARSGLPALVIAQHDGELRSAVMVAPAGTRRLPTTHEAPGH